MRIQAGTGLPGIAAACLCLALCACDSRDGNPVDAFPRKPVKLVVYTGPGGLIDITARKFREIAERHTEATFVVENKPGAGGIVAIKKVLEQPADGYTVLACTKSTISKIVSSGGDSYLDALDWVGYLMSDPECVITRASGSVRDWPSLVRDAQSRGEPQVWVGPAVGGLDHVTALQIWERAGIEAKWVPFKSGGKAKAALLGKQGAAYVGNPRDVLGNSNLAIAAVSSPARLDAFPAAPTFSEFGLEGLDDLVMWRGLAVKQGTPEPIVEWLEDLVQTVAEDPDWRTYWERGGIDLTARDRGEFTQIVRRDAEEFRHYLGRIGVLQSGGARWIRALDSPAGPLSLLALLVVSAVAVSLWTRRDGVDATVGGVMIPLGLLVAGGLLWLLSTILPSRGAVGPAVVPRLWLVLLVPLCLLALCAALRGRSARRGADLPGRVYAGAALLAIYALGIEWLGYYPSTAVFLLLAMAALGVRRPVPLLSVTGGWLLFSWIVFDRILFVPLPAGRVFAVWAGSGA